MLENAHPNYLQILYP